MNTCEIWAAKKAGKSKTQPDKLLKDCWLELDLLKSDILEKRLHWNFAKMHMLSYYAEQIRRYGQVIEYSTEITKAYYEPLKDAY